MAETRKESDVETLTGCLGLLVALPITMTLGTMIHGYVLWKLWGWFVLPLGAPALSFALACGMSLLVRYLVYQQTPPPKKDGAFATLARVPGSVLATGLIAATTLFLGFAITVIAR